MTEAQYETAMDLVHKAVQKARNQGIIIGHGGDAVVCDKAMSETLLATMDIARFLGRFVKWTDD